MLEPFLFLLNLHCQGLEFCCLIMAYCRLLSPPVSNNPMREKGDFWDSWNSVVEIGTEVNPYQHGENLQPISKEKTPNLISKISPEKQKKM